MNLAVCERMEILGKAHSSIFGNSGGALATKPERRGCLRSICSKANATSSAAAKNTRDLCRPRRGKIDLNEKSADSL